MLKRLTFTPVLSTSAYGASDVLFATFAAGQLPFLGQPSILVGVTIHDKDDEATAFTLYFLRSNVSIGTVNEAPDITDANSLYITGKLAVAAADYLDLGGARVAHYPNLFIPVEAVEDTGILYCAGVNGAGTPSYTAATDMVIDLWVER